MLFIGAGGAGDKTLRAIKFELGRIIEAAGYPHGIPDAWQFINFDTTYDGVDYPFPMLGGEHHYRTVPQGVLFRDIKEKYEKDKSVRDLQEILTGWGYTIPAVPINTSYPTQRAVGRHASILDSPGILKALQGSIARMSSPTALGELVNISETLGLPSPDANPQAFLISSLGGTSGSGIFLDIAELLKRATSQQWASNLTSFLYTPEVFDSLGNLSRNLSMNTLGAINEMSAGRFCGLSQRSHLLFEKAGIARTMEFEHGFGPKTNFLIGAKNSQGVDIRVGAMSSGIHEVFAAVGQSIAELLADQACSEHFYNQLLYLAGSPRPMIDQSGLAPDLYGSGIKSFASGIGFAKLSLGSDLLLEYVSDALTKRQIENLLWPELSPEILKPDVLVRQLIEDSAQELWPDFLTNSGLNERGESTQISDKLIPNNWRNTVRDHMEVAVSGNISHDAMSLADFTRKVWLDWEKESDALLQEFEGVIQSNLQSWLIQFREHFQELIKSTVITSGFNVTHELTVRLESELVDYTCLELAEEGRQYLRAVSGFDQVSFQKRILELAGDLKSLTSQEKALLEDLQTSLEKVFSFKLLGIAANLMAASIAELTNNLIKPLIQALVNSRYELSRNVGQSIQVNGLKNPFPEFPNWGSGKVPHKYGPRTTETALIDESDFENIFNLYSKSDGNASFEKFVSQSLLNDAFSADKDNYLSRALVTLKSHHDEKPDHSKAKRRELAPAFEWDFTTDIEKLKLHNRYFLRNTSDPISQIFSMSIRDYVNDPGMPVVERKEREKQFVYKFEAFIRNSEPLISYNELAISKYLSHLSGLPLSTASLLKMGRIPFALNSEIGQRCAAILIRLGRDPNSPIFEMEFFDPTSNKKSISALCTTQSDLPLWAFASLSAPILEEAAIASGEISMWRYFSDGRRSRPLVEAIPFEGEIRRSIITGWFITSFLGMRDVQDSHNGSSVRIWNQNLSKANWSHFPSPLLANSIGVGLRTDWILPALLKSATLAQLKFGHSGDRSEIEGYLYLKYLGREVTCSIPNRDAWDHNGMGDLLPTGEIGRSELISNWVQDFPNPSKDGSVLPLLQKILDRGESRKAALLETVQKIKQEYINGWISSESTPWYKLPEMWELREDLDAAFDDIHHYVLGLPDKSTNSLLSDGAKQDWD
jgi:hypothetical protein